MGYLSKNILLSIYKILSKITDSPENQGATQNLSALRYLFALDRFYKEKGKNCDTKSEDKKLFISYVGEVVKLSDNSYTARFYSDLKDEKDFGVGSNFFSVNAVKDSLTNPVVIVEYPRRKKDGELFTIQNGVLLRNTDLYSHIGKYLSTNELKIAFALWLIRELELSNVDFLSIKQALQRRYSEELINALLPDEVDFQRFCDKYELNELLDFKATINKTDIMNLFPENKNEKRGTLTPNNGQESCKYAPLLTALRTKPFVLLAGISGTGKSRIVRELAKACWKQDDAEFGKNHPKNFCMVQVKPNWHDSSELIGYVSRINGEKYVVGPFLRFMAKAINDSKTPYFLCLDEMNLAPVEQYFAEYLSVIESRKLNADGNITTDPIIDFEHTDAYKSLIDQLFPDDDNARNEYLKESGGKRLTIPQNLFVVGTVNMDETTFSFSRKVLDRAMTIEMNEVDLHGGLDANAANEFGHIQNLIPTSVEGKDVYAQNQELCDKVLDYLAQVNDALDKTPFKIAYRTRNEFLVYAVNRGAENLTAALSAEKITEMLKKLDSGYTSFWS